MSGLAPVDDIEPEVAAAMLERHLQHCRSQAWTRVLIAAQQTVPAAQLHDAWETWLAAIGEATDWYVAFLHPSTLQPARLQGRAAQLVAAMRGPA